MTCISINGPNALRKVPLLFKILSDLFSSDDIDISMAIATGSMIIASHTSRMKPIWVIVLGNES